MTRLRPHIAFALSLCLLLASVALAVARGQAQPVTAAVICSGFGTHVIYLDEEGNPVTGPTLCPDGVTAFVTGADAAPILNAPTPVWIVLARVDAQAQAPAHPALAPLARGPPSLI